MTICAIYARVSDESQLKGDSILHQINYCREHARRRGLEEGSSWITPDAFIYVDEGITGTSMVRRRAVQRLIEQAKAQAFDVVLFKGISRFARDTVDALLMLRTLTACRVRVISMEENFDSQRDSAEFVFTIHSALAQAESEKTAIRVRVGAAEKAKSGQWNGQPPSGYRLNPVTKRLEIDEAMAPLIRDIFSMYVSGLGARKIAEVLNDSGRLTRQGSYWSQRNISRLLRNPVYRGDVVYGRREVQRTFPDESDPLKTKKRAVWVNDSHRLIICKDAHPSIISRELFAKVQATLDKRRRTSGPTENPYLLTKGLFVCTCGSNMTITYNPAGTPYYRCLRQRECGRTVCKSGYVRAHDVERLVLQRVRSDILEFVNACVNFMNLNPPRPLATELAHELRQVQASIQREISKSQKLFDEYAEGHLLDEQYMGMNQFIQHRMMSLQKTRDALSVRCSEMEEHVNLEGSIHKVVTALLSVDTKDVRLTREILALFVERVSIANGVDDFRGITITYRFANPLYVTK